ncbi:hypothetical protein PSP6_10010 [Paraburkholderia tropica]|nr:hypothetical protein PSP6_10010 [Paraburkholderia tropica]
MSPARGAGPVNIMGPAFFRAFFADFFRVFSPPQPLPGAPGRWLAAFLPFYAPGSHSPAGRIALFPKLPGVMQWLCTVVPLSRST